MKRAISILIIILLVAGFVLISGRNSTPENVSSTAETMMDERNNVTVIVEPISISSESPEWKFGITMSTHSVELDHNLSETVILMGARGEQYKPIAWQGSEAGGHHRENVIIFNPIVPVPEIIELRINGIGGESTRIFRWAIN